MDQTDIMIKNDLLLKALGGKETTRPPVWMMRQAGRYLPDYQKLKGKYSFFERIRNPELVAEITVMPVDQIGVDAAILFSDILVIPQAMDFIVHMVESKGPVIKNPIRTMSQALDLKARDTDDSLHYVFEGIQRSREILNDRVPLLGFAGAPWTILCYLIEGKGSKDFSKAKAFCYKHPDAARHVLQVITDTTINYLKQKVKAGVDAVQLFDSWGGLLSPEDYETFSFPYLEQIIKALAGRTKVIVFPKGCWFTLPQWLSTKVHAVSIDWTISPEYAREQTENKITLQGNLDPSVLKAPIQEIQKRTQEMVDRFGKQRYIANLGHGILPTVPVDNARAFVDTIKEME